MESSESRTRLSELAWLFLKLGTTAFGGPAAHIALMQDEVVTRRKWLTAPEFLDMYAATNFIPGPNSTEMAIHIGYRRAGWRGLLVAGACFILPAAVMCTALAAAYRAYGKNPLPVAILWGIKPVVVAIVAQALWRLAHGTLRSLPAAIVAFFAVVALLAETVLRGQSHELLILFASGLALALPMALRKRRFFPMLALPLGQAGIPVLTTTMAGSVSSAPLLGIFLIFLKIGSVLFGSGYVLLAFLQADLVDRRGWLTQQELLDAVAVGQVTPGPVFTTATFIGYLLHGISGAALATLGIFLPAFIFVALSAPLLPMLRKSKTFGAFLDGLNAGSLALMVVVLLRLTRETLIPAGLHQIDWLAAVMTMACLAVLIWKHINSTWLVVAGAAIGVGKVLLGL